jgi:hypothetical protein
VFEAIAVVLVVVEPCSLLAQVPLGERVLDVSADACEAFALDFDLEAAVARA